MLLQYSDRVTRNQVEFTYHFATSSILVLRAFLKQRNSALSALKQRFSNSFRMFQASNVKSRTYVSFLRYKHSYQFIQLDSTRIVVNVSLFYIPLFQWTYFNQHIYIYVRCNLSQSNWHFQICIFKLAI